MRRKTTDATASRQLIFGSQEFTTIIGEQQ